MKQIADGLWQAGTRLGGALPPETKAIFWMIDESPPETQGIILIHYPIPDNDQGLDETVFLRLYHLVDALSDLPIMAVCQAGENRSGLVAVMVLIARGATVEDAIATVQREGNARTHAHSFWNPGFVAQVKRLLS